MKDSRIREFRYGDDWRNITGKSTAKPPVLCKGIRDDRNQEGDTDNRQLLPAGRVIREDLSLPVLWPLFYRSGYFVRVFSCKK